MEEMLLARMAFWTEWISIPAQKWNLLLKALSLQSIELFRFGIVLKFHITFISFVDLKKKIQNNRIIIECSSYSGKTSKW